MVIESKKKYSKQLKMQSNRLELNKSAKEYIYCTYEIRPKLKLAAMYKKVMKGQKDYRSSINLW